MEQECYLYEVNDNGFCYVKLDGRVDSNHSEKLSATLRKIPSDALNVVLDFDLVDYISSVGLREILVLRERLPKNAIVYAKDCNELVYDIFKETGFASFVELSLKDERFEDMSIRDILVKRANKTPYEVFVVSERAYTYKDIDIYSHLMASELFMAGVHRGSHVGILAPNGIKWILAFLAIQKIGAITMPLSTDYDLNDIVRLSNIGKITHLCVGNIPLSEDFEYLRERLEDYDGSNIRKVINIGSAMVLEGREAQYELLKEQFRERQESEDDSCILFTSGSTGNPKAVLHSSYGILHAAKCNAELMHLTTEDRVCINMPLFHTLGLIRGLLPSLLVGASVYMPSDKDPDSLLSFISLHKCTVMNTVPKPIIDMANCEGFSSDKVSSLRVSILGGAAVPESVMKMLMTKFPNDHFIASYGMSEISPITATSYGDTIEHLTTTVGKPLDGVGLKILDFNTFEPLESGSKGEIVVEGTSAMTAYFRVKPESQAFDYDGYIHTGDFGYIDEEGYLHISGRMKELIHYDNKTVEPNEVGGVIASVDSVSDVKVVGVSCDKGQFPVACISLKHGAEFDEDGMRAYLAEKLDDYKIPREFMILDKLPVLSNGKVDAVTLKKLAEAKYGKGI